MRYALLLCVLFVSCSAPRQAEITGDIYVVTRGRDTVKLSGSNVYLLDHFLTQNHIAQNAHENKYDILSGLPRSLYATTADAGGQFRIAVAPDKYFVLVIEQRAVFDTTEFYQWLVPVDATKDVKITLNNSNLMP
jgi:hypothetical protein